MILKQGGPETWIERQTAIRIRNENDVYDSTGWAKLRRQNWNLINANQHSFLCRFAQPCNKVARMYDLIWHDIWVIQKYYYYHCVSTTNWNIVVLLSTHNCHWILALHVQGWAGGRATWLAWAFHRLPHTAWVAWSLAELAVELGRVRK